MGTVRITLDTCIIASAARSRYGASRFLVNALEREQFTLLLSQPLFTEYEAVLLRPEQMQVHGLSPMEVDDFLNTLIAKAVEVNFHWRIRPQLPDPNDEHVLETAVNGFADALVTHNVRDFMSGASRFGVPVLRPSDILKRRSFL